MDLQFLENFLILGNESAHALKGTFNLWLILGAYLLASLGAYTGLTTASLIPSAGTRLKKNLLRWLSAFSYANGFWSMHLVGMFSYKLPVPFSFDPGVTLLSLIVSVITTFFILTLTRTQKPPSSARISFAALLSGLTICTIHYVGLHSLHVSAAIHFSSLYLLAALAVAVLFSGMAITIAIPSLRAKKKPSLRRRIIGAFLLGLAFSGAFYISLAGATFEPKPDFLDTLQQDHQLIALTIFAVATFALFCLTLAISNRIIVLVGSSLLFAIPVIVIVQQSISTVNAEIRTLEKIRDGVSLHKELSIVLRQLLNARDLAIILNEGTNPFPNLLDANQKNIAPELEKVDAIIDLAPELKALFPAWPQLKTDILAFQIRQNTPPTQIFEQYAPLIQSLLRFMSDVGDRAEIPLGTAANENILLNFSIFVVPTIWEGLSTLRAQTALLLNEPSPTNTAKINLELEKALYLINHFRIKLQDVLDRSRLSQKEDLSLSLYYSDTAAPLLDRLQATIQKTMLSPEAKSNTAVFTLISDVLSSYERFYSGPIANFFISNEKRSDSLQVQKDLMLSSSLAALIGFISIFAFLNRALSRAETSQNSAQHAQKELAVRLTEKEHLERQMQDYTDRLELSRFDVMSINTKLKEEEAKIRAIMDNVLEGIVSINDVGIIQTFNQAAENVFGYDAVEAIGRNANILVPLEDAVKPEALIKRYIASGEKNIIGVEHEVVGRRKDGSLFPMIINMSEVILGKTHLFITLVRDITGQKEREADLLRMKERAEAANKTKSEFLANMSHELRTPLNSVLGMTRLLLGTKLSAEQQELANTVLLSSSNLMEIVNDILDLSKIEAGEVVLERIGFDPYQVLHSVVRALSHIAREKHIPIVRLYENQTFPYLMGDPLRLGRVITNLLSNAIKYTDIGHVEIRAETKKIDDTHVEFHCEVCDTGIGIPDDKLQTVFEKFVQADSSTTRRYGGTGLGLAITRELVTRMGGKLSVTSKLDLGSTFAFVIPFEITDRIHEEKYIRLQKTLQGNLLPQNARILVAEDHPMNQLLIRRLLDKFGIGVIKIVSTGIDVLNAYEGNPWTAILMDCHMPEMNGYDATLAIREMEKASNTHIPIIAMTANAMVGDKEKCLNCGMDEYISKPINIEELRDVLSQWIDFYDPASKEKLGDIMTQELPAVDLTMLRTLTGGDAEVEKELMKTFVDQSDKNLAALGATKNEEGENTPWSEAAHMLKGGSGSIGAEELRQLCADAQLYKGDSIGRKTLLEKIEKEYARVKEHLKKEGLLD